MIHQLIFANPKPGMSIKEFQDYWIFVHAQKYARKITQIKKYKVNRILTLASQAEPIFHGVAEIWLENEEEQLASLQADAFLNGARADEPNWAAFWETIGLDTYSYDKILCDKEPIYKMLLLMKRKEGIPLSVFQNQLMGSVAEKIKEVCGLCEFTISLVKDNFYAIGEASFDAVCHLWFESVGEIQKAQQTMIYKECIQQLNEIVNEKYFYQFYCEENRII